jgi:hypothetical protein
MRSDKASHLQGHCDSLIRQTCFRNKDWTLIYRKIIDPTASTRLK